MAAPMTLKIARLLVRLVSVAWRTAACQAESAEAPSPTRSLRRVRSEAPTRTAKSDGGVRGFGRAPYPASGMLSEQASTRLNAVRNDDPDLLAPDAIAA